MSFVGQSGAGKSSLIKLLIDLRLTGFEAWLTPVVGGKGVTEPTSEDVHLYADPVSAITEAPIFFADCEGLSGGEREPMSAKFRRQLKKNNETTNLCHNPFPSVNLDGQIQTVCAAESLLSQICIRDYYTRSLM